MSAYFKRVLLPDLMGWGRLRLPRGKQVGLPRAGVCWWGAVDIGRIVLIIGFHATPGCPLTHAAKRALGQMNCWP